MRKYIFTLLGVCFIPLFANCQYWEFGGFLGGANYSGDLSQQLVTISQTGFAGGVLLRYNVNKKWTVKGNVYYGTIAGDDKDNSSAPLGATGYTKGDRNLSFRSRVLDIGVNGEWNILGYEADANDHRFTPYLFGGVSVFHFNPEAEYNGDWIALQPLGTEGQETTLYNDRRKYNLTQVAIPFGAGFKFNVGRSWNIGLELGWRKTFTDYLDDVSKTYPPDEYLSSSGGNSTGGSGIGKQSVADIMSNRSYDASGHKRIHVSQTEEVPRGNDQTMDWYMFTGITVTYTILQPHCYRF